MTCPRPILFCWLLICGFSCCVQGEISKGHQILIDRGLQVQGMVSHTDAFHLATYSNANYSAICLFWDPAPGYLGAAPGFPWARWAGSQNDMPPMAGESPFMSQLVALQLGDEWDLNNDALRTQLVNWFAAVRTNYPNTILFHNNYGGQLSDETISDYISRAQPDMLCFDKYPWIVDEATGQPRPEFLGYWYSDMRQYREYAKAFGIPLGCYLQTFSSTSDNARAPSRSELRLQVFVALAFNCKTLIDFTYNTGASCLFTNSFGGDNAPNELYWEKGECNLQARNFGRALVRLAPVADDPYYQVQGRDMRTTGILMIRGRNAAGVPSTVPIGFQPDPEDGENYTDWAPGRNDPYLAAFSVTNRGALNGGQRGDVFIAWFKPLDESFDGPGYTNETYLMVVNAFADRNGSPADCAQEIRLDFVSTLTAIERLNPLTGQVEVQSLSLIGGRRQLLLNLSGGDAALFKFSSGAPFVGASVTGPPVITQDPVESKVIAGSQVTLTGRAAGASPISYQWLFNGSPIAGAETNILTLTSTGSEDVGTYVLVASNSFGAVTSAPAAVTIISPTLLLHEPFNYVAIGLPVTSNTPANWAFGGSGPNDFSVVPGSLSYNGLAVSIGNSATNGGSGVGVRRLLGTSLNSGQVYFSVLFRVNDPGYGVWNGNLTQAGGLADTSNFPLQFMVKSNSAFGYVVAIQKRSGLPVYHPAELPLNQTVLFVGRYDFGVTPQNASLWINPPSSTFGAPTPPTTGMIATVNGPDIPFVDRFNFRQNTAASVPAAMQWDELRVGRTWADVTPTELPIRFTSASIQGGNVTLEAIGPAGALTLQCSTNLVHWVEVANLQSATGGFNHSEPVQPGVRHYRLVQEP